jgi:hemolysin III
MSTRPPPRERSHLCDTHREEVASIWTHGIAVVLSFVALGAMIILADDDPRKLVAAIVFGTSLVLLYSASTLYHFTTDVRWKSRFQVLDHACIYLLIAGSYTPVCLLTLRGTLGTTLLILVWAMAAAGVTVKVFLRIRRDHWISTALYLAMGWLVLIVIVPLARVIAPAGMAWLVAGGVAYTSGVGFFLWRRLPYNHSIWHLFVMAGSACHVLATVFHVL